MANNVQQEKYFILGMLIQNKKDVVGYRIASIEHGKAVVQDLMKRTVVATIISGAAVFENAELNASQSDFIYPGSSSKNYPKIDASTGIVFSRVGITVINSVINDKSEVVGFTIIDTYGKMANVRKEKLIELSYRYLQTNYQVYNLETGGRSIKSCNKAFDKVPITQQQAKPPMKKPTNSKLPNMPGVAVTQNGLTTGSCNVIVPQNICSPAGIEVHNFDDIGAVGKDGIEVLAKIKTNMFSVSPYYYSMLCAIPIKRCITIPTAGVTEDTLYYNPLFFSSLSSNDEIAQKFPDKARIAMGTFIMIHEMCHMAMQHTLRGINKIHNVWNVATDLFINESIIHDFNLVRGQITQIGKGILMIPPEGIFLDNTNPGDKGLDFGRDCPETLYAELIRENPQAMQGNNGQGGQNNQQGQQGQQGQGQQGQGQSQGQNQQSQQGQQSGQQGQQSGQQGQQSGQQGQQSGQQGQNQQGQNQQGQGQQSGQQGQQNGQNQQGQGQSQQGQGQGQNQQGQGQNQQGQGQNNAPRNVSQNGSTLDVDTQTVDPASLTNPTVDVDLVLRGKRIAGKMPSDIFTNNGRDFNNPETQQKLAQQSRDALTRIKVKRQIDEQKTNGGKPLKVQGSVSQSIVERDIDFALAPKYKWTAILKRKLNAEPKKKYSYTMPNRNLANNGVTLPTRMKVGKPEKITGIKVCVDVSGSVGDEELHRVFTIITRLLLQFKVEAELIYWDTSINNVGEFSNLKELLKIKPLGFGGTDPRCVFEYLLGHESFNGKKEKTRLKDISLVMIITDGCFNSEDLKQYSKQFNSKVLWIIDGNPRGFNKPFGTVADILDT